MPRSWLLPVRQLLSERVSIRAGGPLRSLVRPGDKMMMRRKMRERMGKKGRILVMQDTWKM